MNDPQWSYATIPPLVVLVLTGLFGLNDVRLNWRLFLKPHGVIELMLGLCFLGTASMAAMLICGIALGGAFYTWRGSVMIWSIAGIFILVGTYAPWRFWLRRFPE